MKSFFSGYKEMGILNGVIVILILKKLIVFVYPSDFGIMSQSISHDHEENNNK